MDKPGEQETSDVRKKIKAMKFITNIWNSFVEWDNKKTDKRNVLGKEELKEEYNKEALSVVTSVPMENGYVVLFKGFIVSNVMTADEAAVLVDNVRRRHIDKMMNKTKEIWY